MKKLLLSLVGLFVAFAANAVDYYLIGGFNGWKESDSNCKFTAEGDGTYVLDYSGTLTSGFKINDGGWKNPNANWGGSATLTKGETYTLDLGDKSGNIPLSENIANPHIVFNPTEKTLLITGEIGTSVITYAVKGDIFGDSNWSSENMTEESGKWTLTKTIQKGAFGIQKLDNGGQVDWIALAPGGTFSVGEATTLALETELKAQDKEPKNLDIAAGEYTFTFDPEAMTLLVTGEESQGGGGDNGDEETVKTVYFDNEGTGWTNVYGYNWTPDKTQPEAPELSTVTIDGHTLYVLETKESKVVFRSTVTEWADSKQTADLDVVDGAVYGVGSLKSKGGSIDAIANIVEGKYVAVEVVEDEYPTMYLVGEMTGWGKSNNYKMTTTDGITYTLTCNIEPNKQFKFFGGSFSSQDNPLDQSEARDLSNGVTKLANGTYDVEPGLGNMTLVKGGEVKFTLTQSNNFATAKLKIEGQEEVVTPNYPVVYLISDRNHFAENPNFEMSTTDGKKYTLHVADAGSDIQFKFKVNITTKEGDQVKITTKYFSTGAQNIHNGTFTIGANENESNMTLHTGGDVSFVVEPIDNFNGGITVTISGQDHNADPYPPIYLIGTMTGGVKDEDYKLQTTDGKTYTITANLTSDDEFQFMGTDAHNYWFSNNDKKMVAGDYELQTTVGKGQDMRLLDGGKVTFTFELSDTHDEANLNIAIESVQEETHDLSYRLNGTTSNTEGVAWTARTMTEKDGKWSITVDNALVKFEILEWCDTHKRKKETISSADENSAANASAEYSAKEDGKAWTSTLTGKTTYTFDPEHMTLTIANEGVVNPPVPSAAKYYLAGGEYGWDAPTEYVFTKGDGDVYTLSLDELKGSFKIVDENNTWYGKGEGNIEVGKEYKLSTAAASPDLNFGGGTVEGAELIFDPANSTLTVNGTLVMPTTVDYYLAGENFGWTNEEENKFTAGENGIYTLEIAELDGGFKIHSSTDVWYGKGENAIELGTPYTCAVGGFDNNLSFDSVIKNAKLVFNSTNNTLTVTGTVEQGGGDDPVDDPTDAKYFLVGDFNGWSHSENQFTKVADDKYTVSVDQITGNFKISVGSWADSWGSNGKDITVDTPYVTVHDKDSQNINLSDLVDNAVVTFVPSTGTITISGDVVVDITHDYVYQLHASLNGEDWETLDMEKTNDNKWSYTTDNGFKKLIIKETDKAVPSHVRWLKSDSDGKIAAKGQFGVKDEKEGGVDWASDLLGKCTYTFDPENMILTVDGSTGINGIEAEEGDVIYFNLQGQRVANPDKGIYIRVVNGKSEKVVK